MWKSEPLSSRPVAERTRIKLGEDLPASRNIRVSHAEPCLRVRAPSALMEPPPAFHPQPWLKTRRARLEWKDSIFRTRQKKEAEEREREKRGGKEGEGEGACQLLLRCRRSLRSVTPSKRGKARARMAQKSTAQAHGSRPLIDAFEQAALCAHWQTISRRLWRRRKEKRVRRERRRRRRLRKSDLITIRRHEERQRRKEKLWCKEEREDEQKMERELGNG